LHRNSGDLTGIGGTSDLGLFERETGVGGVFVLENIDVLGGGVDVDFAHVGGGHVYREEAKGETDEENFEIDVFK